MSLRDHLLRQIATLAASPTPPPVETLEAALADVTAGRLVAAQHRLAPHLPTPASPEVDACPIALTP